MTGARGADGGAYRLAGTVRVALPPREAYMLFTPRGEEQWVVGWRPHFPVAVSDDTAPGTVFETTARGEVTTWVILDRDPGSRIAYARVTPGSRAGTVAVQVDAAADDRHSLVQVTYTLTALTPDGARELAGFAATYPAFLASWEDAIAAFLAESG